MELFTSVEFNEDELDRQYEVIDILRLEGWEEYDRNEYFRDGHLTAIKYRLKRII